MVNSEKPSWWEVIICTVIGLFCQAGAVWIILDPGDVENADGLRILNVVFFCFALFWYTPLVERMFR